MRMEWSLGGVEGRDGGEGTESIILMIIRL